MGSKSSWASSQKSNSLKAFKFNKMLRQWLWESTGCMFQALGTGIKGGSLDLLPLTHWQRLTPSPNTAELN